MSIRRWSAVGGLALVLALAMSSCSDSNTPLSAEVAASASGTVVADQTGAPLPDVTVDLDQCRCGEMMRSNEWSRCESMMTDSQGRFHFEYMQQSTHHYRVTVRGMEHSHCTHYIDSGDANEIVLRVP
jgi:protocatechuate 3,4-dioxygenase beta subunit